MTKNTNEVTTNKADIFDEYFDNKDSNEVIINGVDVSECVSYKPFEKYTCWASIAINNHNCEDCPNCQFKQLQRLKKEDKEIKQKNYELENDFAVQIQATLYHQNEWLKLSKENEKLKDEIIYFKSANGELLEENKKLEKDLALEREDCASACLNVQLMERYAKCLEEIKEFAQNLQEEQGFVSKFLLGETILKKINEVLDDNT